MDVKCNKKDNSRKSRRRSEGVRTEDNLTILKDIGVENRRYLSYL